MRLSPSSRRKREMRLTYDEVRELAQSGDLLFLEYNPKDPLSIFTHLWTGSYTHVGILFWYDNRLLLVESTTHGGNRIVNASLYRGRGMALARGPVPWASISRCALARMGVIKYGWLSAAYIGLRDGIYRVTGVTLPQIKNRHLACSEFVAEVLGLEDTDIPPRKLWELYK